MTKINFFLTKIFAIGKRTRHKSLKRGKGRRMHSEILCDALRCYFAVDEINSIFSIQAIYQSKLFNIRFNSTERHRFGFAVVCRISFDLRVMFLECLSFGALNRCNLCWFSFNDSVLWALWHRLSSGLKVSALNRIAAGASFMVMMLHQVTWKSNNLNVCPFVAAAKKVSMSQNILASILSA